MIAVIDYGMGNIHSVQKALEKCGANAIITDRAADIASAGKVVLPGVGAFDDAMTALEKMGLVAVIKEQLAVGKPFLGICLGMQLLFEGSEEGGKKAGFGYFSGKVRKLPRVEGLKVPHMGWNQIDPKVDCLLFKDVTDGAYVYFCHSYYPEPAEKSVAAAATTYGLTFASAVWKDHVYGTQFHPEKSQDTGLLMLKNFVTHIR